ncbi:hypothetical protein [Lacticaseibacillus mingshuiensis]|uniref:Uncharacterized protein n=1 Tax=Lacticaseibacillus mingshuiensis TaxID=2799574 RepID=A0ABW4CFB8_9LACO|nr:hypothetical protein [Lacticaseibacillus mingshuiensis]
MPNIESKISADLLARLEENSKHEPMFDQTNIAQFEKNIDQLLNDEQVALAMRLMADA